MSDFLDRMATRAIGGDTAVAPRLPSLFEPHQRAPIMSPADEGEMPTQRPEAPSATPAVLSAAPLPPVREQAAELAPRRAPRVTRVERAVVPVPADASRSMPHETGTPVPSTSAPLHPAVEERPIASSPVVHPLEVRPPSPTPLWPRRATSDRHASPPPPSAGSLLPEIAPVFATPHAASAPMQPGHEARTRSRSTAVADRPGATSEPVVHVSIGRLEVRAAPVAATPSRRRDSPKPSNLDDYLRERSGKGTP